MSISADPHVFQHVLWTRPVRLHHLATESVQVVSVEVADPNASSHGVRNLIGGQRGQRVGVGHQVFDHDVRTQAGRDVLHSCEIDISLGVLLQVELHHGVRLALGHLGEHPATNVGQHPADRDLLGKIVEYDGSLCALHVSIS